MKATIIETPAVLYATAGPGQPVGEIAVGELFEVGGGAKTAVWLPALRENGQRGFIAAGAKLIRWEGANTREGKSPLRAQASPDSALVGEMGATDDFMVEEQDRNGTGTWRRARDPNGVLCYVLDDSSFRTRSGNTKYGGKRGMILAGMVLAGGLLLTVVLSLLHGPWAAIAIGATTVVTLVMFNAGFAEMRMAEV